MDKQKPTVRVTYSLTRFSGFFGQVNRVDAVNIKTDALETAMTDGATQDARLYNELVAQLQKDGKLYGVDLADTKRWRLVVIGWMTMRRQMALANDEILQTPKTI